MSYKIATVSVSGVAAVAQIHSAIPAGIVGAYVELTFPDPFWAGLIKNVQFAGAVNVPPILGVGDTVVIPAALVAEPNSLVKIGIIGVAEDGETAITPTLWAELGTVRPSAGYIPEEDESGGEVPEADPETWAQLLAMIGNLRNLTTEQKETLVAAINEVNEKAGGITELQELVEAMGDTLEPLTVAVDDLKQTDADILAEITALKAFHPIEIKSVSNNVGTKELGVTIGSVTVSWVLNKAPVSQTVAGEAVEASVRSVEIPGPFTSGRSFAVTATDAEGNTASKSTSIAFYNGVYYGVLPVGGTIDSAAILSLTRKLQSGKAVTFTATAKDGEKFAYALPARYGTPKFNVGGFDYDWEKAATIDFTNASGYTESYVVWRAYQVVVGTRKIVVT